MPVTLGATPTEVNLNSTDPAIPEGKLGVTFQASDPYPDPNDTSRMVRDVSAYTEAGGGTGVADSVDSPPASPGSLDDEFDAASFDTDRWAWVNQGSAAIDQHHSCALLSAPYAAAEIVHAVIQPAPSTPWEVTARLGLQGSVNAMHAGWVRTGLILYDSGSGRLRGFGQGTVQGLQYINVIDYTNTTTYYAMAAGGGVACTLYPWVYLRIKDDGTDLTFSFSHHGVQFVPIYGPISRTAFLTNGPDYVGIYVNNNQSSGALDLNVICDWFRRTL